MADDYVQKLAAKMLAENTGVLGPKTTITLEPEAYEKYPKMVDFIMNKTQLICAMLEIFFSMQGLEAVTIKFENLQQVRKPEPKKDLTS